MRDNAQIQVNDSNTGICFVWDGFDGDDCFSNFHIDVTTDSGMQQFHFGPCTVHGLKKLSRFFRDDREKSAALGFRYPDVRTCELVRAPGEYRLVVNFEGTGLSQRFCVTNPSTQFDDEFLTDYST